MKKVILTPKVKLSDFSLVNDDLCYKGAKVAEIIEDGEKITWEETDPAGWLMVEAYIDKQPLQDEFTSEMLGGTIGIPYSIKDLVTDITPTRKEKS